MNRYVTLQSLGDGTYGTVVLGQRVDTGEKVRKYEDKQHTREEKEDISYRT